jgi:hypothetical protein
VSSPTRTITLSARVRNNNETVARANALRPGTVGISFGNTPAERAAEAHYKECLHRFTVELARERHQTPVTPAARAPRTNGTRPRERRSTRRTSKASASSGEDGPADPPPKQPRGDGAARLLRDLSAGLDPSALPHAAALCLELDQLGSQAGWRHVSRTLDRYLASIAPDDSIDFPSLEEARREHIAAKARRWS